MKISTISLNFVLVILLASCESFAEYKEYVHNNSDADVWIYANHGPDSSYHKIIPDSILIKKNQNILIYEFGDINRNTSEFDQCDFLQRYFPNGENMLYLKKEGAVDSSIQINERSKWIFKLEDKRIKTKSFKCECIYEIKNSDF